MPYHWGRFKGMAEDSQLKADAGTGPRYSTVEQLMNNIYFDTCVYHQPGIDLLTSVVPPENILFASEMVGAVRGVDPESGEYYDDTKRYVEAALLTVDERQMIFEDNARRVFPRLNNYLDEASP